MARYAYDIETDGLLEQVTKLHCLVMIDLDTGEEHSLAGHSPRLRDAIIKLNAADLRVGHNIINYDERVLEKLFPDIFQANPDPDRVLDTMIMSQLIWPNIFDLDGKPVKAGSLPARLRGGHGLEAWGHRLGLHKGDYAKARAQEIMQQHPGLTKAEITKLVWANWSPAMQHYCAQDVKVTLALRKRIEAKGFPEMARHDEMAAAILCARITETGFGFDRDGAVMLYGELAQLRQTIEQELRETFGQWIEHDEEPTVPVSRTSNGNLTTWGEHVYQLKHFADGQVINIGEPQSSQHMKDGGFLTKGGLLRLKDKFDPDKPELGGFVRSWSGFPFTRIRVVSFNPKSRAHIANRLIALRGWEPEEKTDTGGWKVDETILGKLDPEKFPEAVQLTRYLTIVKRLGQIAEGKEAWLKASEADGKVHGEYRTAGAVTRRATHRSPNIAQVPKVKLIGKDIALGEAGGWGYECRSLFRPNHPGWVQVGTDASGLELRCLAHYMANWDGGAYGKILLEGDIHSANQEAAGLPSRDDAKTFIYGFLYGAGDAKIGKIGKIVGGDANRGKALRRQFLAGFPALDSLIKAVQAKAKAQGYVLALDKAPMHIRSQHAALNTLLQGSGALICKSWLIEMARMLRDNSLVWGRDYEMHAWVHDEVQASFRTRELAELFTQISGEAMAAVARKFSFRCPLATDSKIGSTWAECH